ncbi:MAG: hypothetical protein WCL51_05635 [Bacteroidota bacterium]
MIFFKKRTKVDLKEFCKQYYDEYFLELKLTPIADFNLHYNELISEKITEVDSNFKSVDFRKFCHESLIIRFELFSLAWFHHFGNDLAIKQSIFTKEYLVSKDKEDIWDDAEAYNQAIAASATHGHNTSKLSDKYQRLHIAETRMALANKYNIDSIDGKCIARALNKYGTNAKNRMLKVTLLYIGIAFCKNLDYKVNEKAMVIIIGFLKGLYDGSKQSFEEIKII